VEFAIEIVLLFRNGNCSKKKYEIWNERRLMPRYNITKKCQEMEMPEMPEQWLVAAIDKCGKQFARNLITTSELVNYILDIFADSDAVYSEIIPSLWDSIPAGARFEFIEALRAAMHPEFRYHAFEIGGSRGLTDDERRFQQERNARRVNAWATEFLRFLDSNEAFDNRRSSKR
jgi:hypothetical protein